MNFLPIKTKQVKIGSVIIGGGAAIAVQSMTNTKTYDVEATVGQIKRLQQAGSEIVRVSVPDEASVEAIPKIKGKISIPLVADIHFKTSLAVKAIEAGADKIRINPGTFRNESRLQEVISAAGNNNIPIRIGINGGSLPAKYDDLKHKDLARALVESAMEFIDIFEQQAFNQLVISCKATDVIQTIKAYQQLSQATNYPLHLGITEAGTLLSGSIKSAVGLGVLLFQGIGDTIRVSLTADPVEEVRTAYKILGSLNIRQRGADIISCPSCARCDVDVISLANKIEQALIDKEEPLKVAVMGCEVNGPGEAKEADVGMAAGKKSGLIFKKGQIVGRYDEGQLFEKLMEEIEKDN